KQFRIANQGEIRLQPLWILLYEFLNSFAAYFFFAFIDDSNIDWQLAAIRLEERFEGLYLHPKLALIVDGAARIEVVIALGRLKRRSLPLIKWLRRLNVEVCIYKSGRFA